jgi:hypothetical protein
MTQNPQYTQSAPWGLPELFRRSLRVLGRTALLLVVFDCSEDPQKNLVNVEPPPEGYPLSYLYEASNSNTLVRWTAQGADPAINIHVAVDDIDVPAGFNSSFWANVIPAKLDMWLDVLRQDGHDVTTNISYQSKTGPPPADSGAVLHIKFQDKFDSRVAGTTAIDIVQINRCFTSETVTLALRDSNGTTYPQFITSTVLLHELGHALGIFATSGQTAHSPDSSDIMFPTININQNGLSAADRQTIRHLYSMTPRYRSCATAPLAKPTTYIVAAGYRPKD